MALAPSTGLRGARTIDAGSYAITLAHGALAALGTIARAQAPAHRYVIVTDDAVAALYGREARQALGGAELLTIPPGEEHKTREQWAAVTDQMLERQFGRDTVIVALGGGVVGDLAGFVAATYMRGVPFIQVPTTLLAMIDASVGGKTAVDTPVGKNLVGVFHQPAAVVVDPELLVSLPPEQLRAGMAEAIKHGVIADAAYLDAILRALPVVRAGGEAAVEALIPIIARSIEIKTSVVARDEREAGVRKVLNFGHTLGHAVEVLGEYRILHGRAVAIGMVLEAELGERIGVSAPGTADAVRRAVRAAGLPTGIPAGQAPESLLLATRADKKARQGQVEYALPARVGAMAGEERGWGIPVGDADVLAVLASAEVQP
ncbi:MAG: 3-dehydroquinate synthase [Gemmatimonadaceae bacterium]